MTGRTTERRRIAATALLALAALALMGAGRSPQSPAAAATCAASQTAGPARVGHISGIARAHLVSGACARTQAGAVSSYAGTPPLTYHGGPVMATPSAGNHVVVTPIFWQPSGYPMTTSYKNVITTYLADLAADSEQTTNVFATMFQYSDSNGAINYRLVAGTPITDTTAFPAAGCTTNSGQVYGDGTGYTTCLDDAQIEAETDAVATGQNLPRDYGHLYVVFLPQHVESCFEPGNPTGQQCTINPTPSAAYCAYHSAFSSGGPTVYATMPFPVYNSATGYSCTTENLAGAHTIQHPNGDPDADVEISPLSHEMAEAFTDPLGNGWHDSSGYENGDECAYIYGALSGADGALWNQAVNGHHYLTQEEFSQADYSLGHEACLPSMPATVPSVGSVSPATGPDTGGTSVTITGTGFPGTTAVTFGGTAATFTVTDATHLTAVAPARAAGQVDVRVATSAGTSSVSGGDEFTYSATQPTPAVTAVTPASGPSSGGRTVTITGTDLTGATAVHFGTASGTSVQVLSPTSLTVVTPAHAAGTVEVTVTTNDGTSATSSADRYRYLAQPRVTSVSPRSGRKAGGTRVTVVGTGFASGAVVRFGTAKGTSVRVLSSTRLTVRSPRHAAGRVHVSVRTGGGTSARTRADRYTFT